MNRPLFSYLHPSLRAPARRIISRVAPPIVRFLFLRRPVRTTMEGLRLRVTPGVFHPKLFFTTRILMRHISQLPLAGKSVLDMGTGSGAIGLTAARFGAHVIAMDINPEAVSCAEGNARENGLAFRFTAIESDLFEALPRGTLFDLILWNPPFYPKEPANAAEAAWYSGKEYRTIERFALSAASFLRPAGSIILLLSSDIDIPFISRILEREGFGPAACIKVHSLFESFDILRFEPSTR